MEAENKNIPQEEALDTFSLDDIMAEFHEEEPIPEEAVEAAAEVAAEEAAEAPVEDPAAEVSDAEPEAPEASVPEKKRPAPRKKASHKAKAGGKHTLASRLKFYIPMVCVAAGILILLWCATIPMGSWLEQYELSQPKYMAAEVHKVLFTDPDWKVLYNMAGVKSTEFEGQSAYVSYMQNKVGSDALEYVQTSAGLTGKLRYSVRHKGQEIAAFYLQAEYSDGSSFPVWKLDGVEVFFERTVSLTVNKMPGHTVYINGVPLDDSYTTMSVSTAAESFLSNNIHGFRWEQQRIDGLLVQPEITVLDEYNQPLPLTQDPETGIYTVPIATSDPISDTEYTLALDAVKAQALFAVRQISITDLRQHFDPNSKAYKDLIAQEALVKNVVSYTFDESATEIKDFYRYSDTLFSIRASVTLEVTDKKGNTQTLVTDTTYFFAPNHSGHFMVTNYTNTHLQEQLVKVRLNFSHNGQIIHTGMYSTTAPSYTTPEIPVPEGQSVHYWGKLEADGTVTPVLRAFLSGSFILVDGQDLESMTLVPIFGEER